MNTTPFKSFKEKESDITPPSSIQRMGLPPLQSKYVSFSAGAAVLLSVFATGCGSIHRPPSSETFMHPTHVLHEVRHDLGEREVILVRSKTPAPPIRPVLLLLKNRGINPWKNSPG